MENVNPQNPAIPLGTTREIGQEPLTAILSRYFGFQEFRPLQREIVEESLANRDVIALLPTGGGKSLCYQLPALVRPGLTVVISPLIALMKDQVDALEELEIPATFLNSSLSSEESAFRIARLFAGQYRLLYLSPERALMDGTLEFLAKWNLEFLAIDEAHCVSEWGHDFRPEYQELSKIRDTLPHVPIIALTATATPRVRHDIAGKLGLRDPRYFVASFNRPNLSYRVIPRAEPIKQIVEVIEAHRGESGIVYCMSRATTERVADSLLELGYRAVCYHAGLSSRERTERQERFIRDEVDIVVATIAFGMGIDKPDVRFVIHHDLPKHIEGYYQETGRAGRDGLPSECVLLYSAADVAKLSRFLDDIPDEHEREIARRQLNDLLRFADSHECRRMLILKYFGETYADSNGSPLPTCGACDNCLTPREIFDGTEVAQKILSCVIRVHQKSGFSVGMHHIVDVLLGSQSEKIVRFGHETLSTYGIGRNIPRQSWLYWLKDLVRQGYLAIRSDKFNVIEVTAEGREVLRLRTTVSLPKPLLSASLTTEKRREQKKSTGYISYDEALYANLKSLRARLAKSKNLPAYVIFHDTTLQELARNKPKTHAELLTISGIGEKKAARYGELFLSEIASYSANSAS